MTLYNKVVSMVNGFREGRKSTVKARPAVRPVNRMICNSLWLTFSLSVAHLTAMDTEVDSMKL